MFARIVTSTLLVSLIQPRLLCGQFLAREMVPSTPEEFRQLLQEVEDLFGKATTRSRVPQLESLLHPIFVALPKDERGGLGHAAVRYALHRFFQKRHGWHMSGLGNTGGAWNESSATSILEGKVPSYMQGLFDQQLGEQSFGLHELAVFVAALEHLIRIETSVRVEAAYGAKRLETEDVLSEDDVDKLLDTQFLIYMFAPNVSNSSWVTRIKNVNKVYPGWADTQTWMRDTRKNLAFAERDVINPFVPQTYNFPSLVHMTEELNDKHGMYHGAECREVKDTLLMREFKGTGRIRLVEFYGLALAGDWRFSEKREFLRQLGALDEETDPSDPRVIVPNYIYGKSNCIATSPYYSVCCPNECEALLDHLDRDVAAPVAEPGRLAAEVAQLSSSTVAAPRNLSAALVQRLDQIATLHGGMVPIHGRLFALFMHQAFPRECPFPHLSGTTEPLTSREWRARTGSRATLPMADLQTEVNALDPHFVLQPIDVDEDELSPTYDTDLWVEPSAWTDQEELIPGRLLPPPRASDASFIRKLGRNLIMLVAIGSMGGALTWSVWNGQRTMAIENEKQLV